MRKTLSFPWIVCLLAFALASSGYAQTIIVKFRSSTALSAPGSQLRTLSETYFARPLAQSHRFYTPRQKGQIPLSVSSIGLERIVIIPIKSHVSAAAATSSLSALPEVEWAQPNYIYKIEASEPPNDSLFTEQWSHKVLEVQKAWEITKGDSSVKIGFVDTGVDWLHPDLVGQFAVNPPEDINNNKLFDAWPSTIKLKDEYGNEVFGDLDGIDNDGNGYADDVIGYDFIDQQFLNFGDVSTRDPIPNDEYGHGTSVAGVIAAKENNKVGIAGIAPGCKLVALRTHDATGNAEDDDIASAIVYAADNGVDILNLSFGDIWPSLLQRDAIRYAESKGCLVFASSGNRGGSGRHYPSDFDECVSVGATGEGDRLYFQSTMGESQDLVAPGNSVLTTATGGEYAYLSGTSFSSPTAAAVAGLILSKNPQLTPRELRSILTSTTNDLFPYGYDHQHSNGRVNAYAAVAYVGSASIKIESPGTNDGFHVGDEVPIIGSAASTLFTEYAVSYARGLNPDIDTNDEALWTPINTSDKQAIQAILGTWNTAGLAPGTYTLRLAVRSSDGDKLSIRSTEERITVELKSKAPLLVTASVDSVYIGEKTGLFARFEADTLTYATLYYRGEGSDTWLSKSDDKYSRRHAIVLTSEETAARTSYELLLVARNAAGDSSTFAATVVMPDIAANQRAFQQKSYSLPLGFVLDTVIQTPQGATVIESVFPPGSDFGPVFTYSFDTTQKKFRKTDSTSAWVPRDLGSIDGQSRDLLMQGGTDLIIHRGNSSRSVFGDIVRYDTTNRNDMIALGYANPDGNGTDEIVVIHQVTRQQRLIDVIEVRSAASNDFLVVAELANTTGPAREYRDNRYQKPDVRAKDLNGNGKEEIVILDDDADLLVFTRNDAGTYETMTIDSNIGYTEGTMVSIGDLNGDGKQDIAYAFHTSFDENAFGEYDPKYWTVKVLLGNGDGSFRRSLPTYFWNARSDRLFRSSLGTMKNVTGSGSEELGISFFPDFYLFKFDDAANRLVPQWHFPVSITPRTGLVHDFDNNGIPEFAINTGDSTHFFEREYLLAGRTAAPSGLEALPRDTNRVDLQWGNVTGATEYYVLRALESDNTFTVIDTTTALTYSDTTVTNLTTYVYSIVAFDPEKQEELSQLALAVEAFVHPKPVITEVTSNKEFVRIKSSQPLREVEIEGAGFLIDNISCLTAAVASDSFVVLRAAHELSTGMHELHIRTHRLRDIWNSPLDTGLAKTWEKLIEEPDRRFYIVKWRFENSRRIYVEFNNRPGENALDVARYTLTPYGTLVKVYRDQTNPNALFIDLANTSIVALGVPFVLCVEGITDDIGTPIEKTEGNCIGVTVVEPDLANILVYPNPARITDEKVIFARLTPEAEVSIYTTSQRLLRRIKTSDRSGGVEWDLRDEAGKDLPSGVYIYQVTGKDEDGNDVESNEAKFVIVRDR